MFSYSVRHWGYTSSEAARVVLRYWGEAGETFAACGALLDDSARWRWLRAVLAELRAESSCRHERRALAGAWADGARRVLVAALVAEARRARAAALVGAACLAGGCAQTGNAAKPLTTACGVARAACAVVEAACGVADAAAPASAGGEEP